jgi:hypothetical protein
MKLMSALVDFAIAGHENARFFTFVMNGLRQITTTVRNRAFG